MAIQYGMSLNDFWHGDVRLLEVYEKAYHRNVSLTSWQQGARVFEAVSKAIYNGFGRQKKTDRAEQYSEYQDPVPVPKKKITKENLEHEFRQQQVEQNAWLFHK